MLCSLVSACCAASSLQLCGYTSLALFNFLKRLTCAFLEACSATAHRLHAALRQWTQCGYVLYGCFGYRVEQLQLVDCSVVVVFVRHAPIGCNHGLAKIPRISN